MYLNCFDQKLLFGIKIIVLLVLLKKESISLEKDLTSECQNEYNLVYGTNKYPFRGKLMHIKFNGISMLVSTIHHSKINDGNYPDKQLQNILLN